MRTSMSSGKCCRWYITPCSPLNVKEIVPSVFGVEKELGTCFMLDSSLVSSSILNAGRNIPPKHHMAYNGIRGVLLQRTEQFV